MPTKTINTDLLNDSAFVTNVAQRVHYATGILLSEEDFRAEQQYHRGRLARSLQYLHGTGTVAGLRVSYVPRVEPAGDDPGQDEQIWVDAGLAIDYRGRLIELRNARCLRLERWYAELSSRKPDQLAAARQTVTIQADRFNADESPALPETVTVTGVVVDLFVRFLVCEVGRTPAFANGPFDALDAVQPSRLGDEVEVIFVPRTDADPRYPADPYADLNDGLDAIADPAEREATRRLRLRQIVFGAWDEPADPRARRRPVEIPAALDDSCVFLARVVIPADAPADANTAPARDLGAAVEIDNASRLFAYTTRALAAWIGS
ncbi:hypothetical protein GC175_17595 [bacterium]|nr:hypothetical protein [bacterium]